MFLLEGNILKLELTELYFLPMRLHSNLSPGSATNIGKEGSAITKTEVQSQNTEHPVKKKRIWFLLFTKLRECQILMAFMMMLQKPSPGHLTEWVEEKEKIAIKLEDR